MVHILELANEILIKITSYLRSDDHLRLSLCSSHFNAISQAFLYKTVSLSRRSIPLLVRSLYNQPSLALLIESVQFDDIVNEYSANAEVVLDNIEDEDLALLPLPQPWYDLELLQADLRSHQGDAWLALLLYRLDNLTKLEWHFRHSPVYVTTLLRSAASEEWKHSRFSKLQAIRFWMDKEVLLDWNPVLQLPALRALDVENLLYLTPEEPDLQTCGVLDLNVQHLKDPIMSPPAALPLLWACGSLKRCTIFLAGEHGAGGNGNYVVEIFDALLIVESLCKNWNLICRPSTHLSYWANPLRVIDL